VTDSSLSHSVVPGYVIVSVKPSCFVPSQISDNRKTVILLQDIQLERGTVCYFLDWNTAFKCEDMLPKLNRIYNCRGTFHVHGM
jgi:hypothetical protein